MDDREDGKQAGDDWVLVTNGIGDSIGGVLSVKTGMSLKV